MILKFKVDENLPTEAAELLASAGHDTVTVHDQGMVGQPDTNVAAVCQREDRVVVTLDLDFADIRTYPPADHAGIIGGENGTGPILARWVRQSQERSWLR